MHQYSAIKKWLPTLLVLVGVLVAGGLGYWLVQRSNRSSIPVKSYAPQYVIESRIPGITVMPTENAAELIESWMDQYGYSKPREFALWSSDNNSIVQPEALVFAFLPLESLEETDKGSLLYPVSTGDVLLAGVMHNYQANILEYRIYMNRLYFEENFLEKDEVFSYHLYRSLLTGLVGTGKVEIYGNNWREIYDRGDWVVEVKETQSWWNTLMNVLVPKAYAQCGGLVECGYWQTGLFCDNGVQCINEGAACPQSGYVGGTGTCTSRTGCFISDGCANCGGDSNVKCSDEIYQTQCLSIGCSFGGPYCTYRQCWWGTEPAPTSPPPTSGPTSAPSRTPTPLPPGFPSPTPTRTPTPLPPGFPTPTSTPLPPGFPSPTPTSTPAGGSYTISGTVFVRSDATNNACSYAAGDLAWSGANSMIITASSGESSNVSLTGNYIINNVPSLPGSTRPITFSGLPTGYSLICSNPYSVPNANTNPNSGFFTSNVANAHWFIRASMNSWWQTVGGDVGVNGGNIENKLPLGEFASEVTLQMNDGVLTYSGGLDWGAGQFSVRNLIVNSTVDTTPGKKVDYGKLLSLFTNHLGTYISPTGTTPTGAYVHSGDLTINSAIGLAPGAKAVYFIDGNLSFGPLSSVTVLNGEFIAFIVKGDIIVDPAVTNLQGMFLTNKTITINRAVNPIDEKQFVGQGMFIGWGGVSLNRDLGADNATMPAEKFIYRPDLVINAPDWFRQTGYEWREVAP
jgi:hypothetical protein